MALHAHAKLCTCPMPGNSERMRGGHMAGVHVNRVKKQARSTPIPKTMGLSTPRSGGGGAAQATPTSAGGASAAAALVGVARWPWAAPPPPPLGVYMPAMQSIVLLRTEWSHRCLDLRTERHKRHKNSDMPGKSWTLCRTLKPCTREGDLSLHSKICAKANDRGKVVREMQRESCVRNATHAKSKA